MRTLRIVDLPGFGTLASVGGFVTLTLPVLLEGESEAVTLAMQLPEAMTLGGVIGIAEDTVKVVPFADADLEVRLVP